MKKLSGLMLLVMLLAGCRDPYDLPLRQSDTAQLVVEGALNAGQGPTTITLSQTVSLNEPTAFLPVTGAAVTVEDKSGGTFPLSESGNGRYTHLQLPLSVGQEYRLHIRTGSKEYVSDYVVAKPTPVIDSISWKKDGDALRVLVNAHDAANATRYYRWESEETWEIRSYYAAQYQWTGGTTIVFSPNYNYQCWKEAKSTNLLLGSTTQLQADVVSEAPIVYIPAFSDKLSVRYSILVKQQSLTKEAYAYLQLMKKNTESLGSIFDPQPSELRGNFRCVTNPAEGVIGYLTASEFREKRIFLTAREVDWKFPESCPEVQVADHPDSISLRVPTYLPYSYDQIRGIYFMAKATCVDCTARGGGLNKPAFW